MAQLEIAKLLYTVTSKLDKSFTATMTKAETSAVKVGKSMEKSTNKVKNFGKSFLTVKNAVLGFIAGAVIKGTVALLKQGAELDTLTESFNRLSADMGLASNETLDILKKNSAGTISNRDLILSANRAMVLGVASDTKEFGDLMNIARLKARSMGLTTSQAFDDIVTGIGRGSPLILDNLGIVIKVTEAQEIYAKSLGKTANELNANEKREALKFAVIQQGNAEVAKAGELTLNYSDQMAIASTKVSNLKTTIGSALLPAMGNLLGAFNDSSDGMLDNSEKADNLSRSMFTLSNALVIVGATVKNLANISKVAWNGVQLAFNAGTKIVLETMKAYKEDMGEDTTVVQQALDDLGQTMVKNADEMKDAVDGMADNGGIVKKAYAQILNPTDFEGIRKAESEAREMAEATKEIAEAVKISEEAQKKAKDELDGWTKSLIDARDEAKKTGDVLEEGLANSFEKFAEGIQDNFNATTEGLADIVVEAQKQAEALKKAIRDTENDGERKDLKDQLKQVKEVFEAEQGYEERRAERITAIRAQLEEAGIDAQKAGIDALATSATLEEQIEEKKRIASLDAFTRLEEEQFKKLDLIIANFIQENALLTAKIEKQKELENELTDFMALELGTRQEDIDLFAQNALAKYGKMASALRNIISLQARVDAPNSTPSNSSKLPQFHTGGYVGRDGGEVHSGEFVIPKQMVRSLGDVVNKLDSARGGGNTNTVHNNRTVNAPININAGDREGSLSDLGKEIAWELKRK